MASFLAVFTGLVAAIDAVRLPRPSGEYYIGQTQHVFNHTTLQDPLANGTTKQYLLATIYFPSPAPPLLNETVLYVDPINFKIWANALQYPNGSISTIQTWWNFQSPTLNASTGNPTIIFSPSGGAPIWGYSALLSDLASRGYPLFSLDHPGEVPFTRLPFEGRSIYELDIKHE
ncbi:hypothetical protein LTS18_003683 [Coniosporium uncinatum]|uniref:Uncharacterized protein n=1 Tax=Coniosporium uncinatum TaxID=93489 RepID=A0ACC3DT67_9PEZI|nr:hypothetical protein LTS18_003683 [Coniosporium uncinatum]